MGFVLIAGRLRSALGACEALPSISGHGEKSTFFIMRKRI